jgi:hypothetical protein
LVEEPPPASQAVIAARADVLQNLDLGTMLVNLERTNDLLYVAACGVSGNRKNPELSGKVAKLQYGLLNSCSSAAIAMGSFGEAAGTVLTSLRQAFRFLYTSPPREDRTITVLSRCEAQATAMADTAGRLATSFKQLADDAEGVLEGTLTARDMEEQARLAAIDRKRELNAQSEKAKTLKEEIAKQMVEVQKLVDEAREAQNKAEDRAFGLAISGNITSALGSAVQGFMSFKMAPINAASSLAGAVGGALNPGAASPVQGRPSAPPFAAPPAGPPPAGPPFAAPPAGPPPAGPPPAGPPFAAPPAGPPAAGPPSATPPGGPPPGGPPPAGPPPAGPPSAAPPAGPPPAGPPSAAPPAGPPPAGLPSAAPPAGPPPAGPPPAAARPPSGAAPSGPPPAGPPSAGPPTGAARTSTLSSNDQAAVAAGIAAAGARATEGNVAMASSYQDIAERYANEKAKWLDLLVQLQKEQREALGAIAQYAEQMKIADFDTEAAKSAVDSLQQAVAALKQIVTILETAKVFWEMMAAACKRLASPTIRQDIELFKDDPPEERLKEYARDEFKLSLLRLAWRWCALKVIADDYRVAVTRAREEVASTINKAPSIEEAKKLAPALGAKLALDINKEMQAIDAATAQLQAEQAQLPPPPRAAA